MTNIIGNRYRNPSLWNILFLVVRTISSFLVFASIFVAGCKESDAPTITLITMPVTDIKVYSATAAGEVVADKPLSEKGLVWNSSSSMDVKKEEYLGIRKAGVGSGKFTGLIFGLKPRTTYYVRAYAIYEGKRKNYYFYGDAVGFTTLAASATPGDFCSCSNNTITHSIRIINNCQDSILYYHWRDYGTLAWCDRENGLKSCRYGIPFNFGATVGYVGQDKQAILDIYELSLYVQLFRIKNGEKIDTLSLGSNVAADLVIDQDCLLNN